MSGGFFLGREGESSEQSTRQCILLYYIILYCIVLYYIVLYCVYVYVYKERKLGIEGFRDFGLRCAFLFCCVVRGGGWVIPCSLLVGSWNEGRLCLLC